MTTESSAPPAIVQSLLMRVLRSPLHGLLSKNLLLLSFTGRKSGKRYQIPVAYVRDGARVLIASRASWWKNLVGGAPVEVLLRGKILAGTAQVAQAGAEREADLRRVLCGGNQVARFMQVTLDSAGNPDPQQFAAALDRGWVVVSVQLPQA